MNYTRATWNFKTWIDKSIKFFCTFSLEQIKHIWTWGISSHLRNNLILILPNKFALESAENLQQFEIYSLFDLLETNFLRRIVDSSDEFGHIECEEFLIILENLIEKQRRHPVSIDIS